MFYEYKAGAFRKLNGVTIDEPAIFTTFVKQQVDLQAHLQRLQFQSKTYLSIKTQIQLAHLQQAQYLATKNEVIKVIVTKRDQWYVAIRKRPDKIEELSLQSVLSETRTQDAKMKDYHRTTYLNQFRQSQQAGFDDALYYTAQGIVLETTIANIFWSDGQRLYTPTRALPILVGTFQQRVLQQCQAAKIEVCEVTCSLLEMKRQAKQIWCCNAVRGWQSVARLDDDWQQTPTSWTRAITKFLEQQE